MSDDSLTVLYQTSAAVVAMRSVLVSLLAAEARRQVDPAVMFEKISAAVAANARTATEGEPSDDPTAIAFQEMVQSEADSLIGTAKAIVASSRC